MDNNLQKIYICMDDSGQLIKNGTETLFVYGGIYFQSKEEMDNFSRQYKSLVNQIKSKYCNGFKKDLSLNKQYCLIHNKKSCKYKCPELKSNMLHSKDKRRLLNFIKKYNVCVAVVINNKLRDHIFRDKASKGRYKDYVIKREIKEIVKTLISQNRLDKDKPVKIILNLDEQTTVSNGYYDLRNTIIEELQDGIYNYNYDILFPPLLSSVDVVINYKDSYLDFTVQAADLIVGEVRHKYNDYLKDRDLNKYRENTNFIDTSIYLP